MATPRSVAALEAEMKELVDPGRAAAWSRAPGQPWRHLLADETVANSCVFEEICLFPLTIAQAYGSSAASSRRPKDAGVDGARRRTCGGASARSN